MDSVRYATELKTLVDYQAQQGREVLFRLQQLSDTDDRPYYVVDTVKAVRPEVPIETAILDFPSVEPFALWEHDGYIRVVTGGLRQNSSIFRLTERGVKAVEAACRFHQRLLARHRRGNVGEVLLVLLGRKLRRCLAKGHRLSSKTGVPA